MAKRDEPRKRIFGYGINDTLRKKIKTADDSILFYNAENEPENEAKNKGPK